ncbi:hypothetical protein [Rhizorhabdus dicambivorans]|uniref:DUF429 domain-containing protein n=1 Tax=Rhizorhabdus dicambivorans TaxID=1850238 RepID=A0A2A4FUD0_9SPHN|nr:hypothetical protein [Rhizorhabdus dicambivorans]ATE64751.1 hypothetical protein CMV14_10345 [Rhizorhabdus dicambivorans]PCE41306.1 hypothetical protein COO09_15735 [Rhizorhabdus dicambivorans]
MIRRFARFACIDWSGAKGERQKGITVAISDGPGRTPRLIERAWSRQAVLDWLIRHARRQSDLLIGIDFSAALPFLDAGAYFPGWPESPPDARALWRQIDAVCAADPHLETGSFIDHGEISRHFRRHGGRQGDLFGAGNGRYRLVERLCREGRHAPATSCFNLVGAAQVGKSSLTGMRMLHRLGGKVPVWPFDPVPERGPLIVEIYTTIAARQAGLSGGSKMRDADRLRAGLAGYGIRRAPQLARYDDHSTDAILTAAWLAEAAAREDLWHPPALSGEIALLEGWTFGIP